MMNDAELALVVEDLQALIGLSVSGLWQPARDRVVVGIGDRTHLLCVPRGPVARMHTIARRPRNPPRPFSFQGACRSRLRGRLEGLHKVEGDRVLQLVFSSATLELRLTGRSGGLWLLQDDAVVAAYDGPAPDRLPALHVRPVRQDRVRFEPLDDSWDLGARAFFDRAEREHTTRERRGLVQRRLKRAIQRTERLLVNLERDLERADEAPKLRQRADLLAAHLHEVPRGASHVVFHDWDTGEPVSIELDPSRPVTDTLEQLYRRAGRLDRVGDRVLLRIDSVEAELADLRRHLVDLPEAELPTLRQLESRLPAAPTGPRSSETVLPWWTWLGPQGERVLVGRNERGNRKLTFQVARGSDWWMHLRGRPGAHVVLPMKREQTPGLPLLLAAAQIALVHGKVTEGTAVDVQYARIRDVRAIPGEIAKVRVADERVLRVTRDAAELVGWVREDAPEASPRG